MKSALDELRRLLSGQTPAISGKIVELNSSYAKVQTARGTLQVAVSPTTVYPIGSYVVVKDSVIIGRARDPKSSTNYSL
jgi:hypothetical protein